MISQETIDKVKNSIQIEEIIGDFVDLKKEGSNYKGLCPFHNEKTPSFVVSPSKGVYSCFGSCDEKGKNAINFLMKHESLNYREAIEYIAKKQGIKVVYENNTKEENEKREEKESIYILNKYAQEFYEKQLYKSDNEGLNYLKSRGFTEEVIKKFNIGYTSIINIFTKEATKEGNKIELLEKAGLTKEGGYDAFRNRIIFPIYTHQGEKIAGFGGRIIKNDGKNAKYINTKETPTYNKSQLLFGLYHSKEAIRKKDACYIVEGYTDVLAFHQKGIENVVAACGTALTKEQIQLIKRFTEDIILIFDGDNAGINSSRNKLGLFLEEGLHLKIVQLPNNEDPFDIVNRLGKEGTIGFINSNAKNFIDYHISLVSVKDLMPNEETELIENIAKDIAKIPNEINRESYLKYGVKQLKIKRNVLENAVENYVNKIVDGKIDNIINLLQKDVIETASDFFTKEENEKKISWNKEYLNLELGDLVSFKVFSFETGITEVNIEGKSTYKIGQTNMQPPIMVVDEIVKEDIKNIHLFDEKTGKSKKYPIKVHCIWYSNTKHNFCENWFNIDVLIKLKTLHDSINFKPFDVVSIKTKVFSNQQSINKTSIVQGEKFNKITIEVKNIKNQRNIPPNMVITSIENIPNKNKLPVFDKSTGKRKRVKSDRKVKCMWYNPKEEKFSEKYFSPEILTLTGKNSLENNLSKI